MNNSAKYLTSDAFLYIVIIMANFLPFPLVLSAFIFDYVMVFYCKRMHKKHTANQAKNR